MTARPTEQFANALNSLSIYGYTPTRADRIRWRFEAVARGAAFVLLVVVAATSYGAAIGLVVLVGIGAL